MEYEDITMEVLEESTIDSKGIYLSWNDLWRIDGVAVRNARKALSEGNLQLFQAYVGQRMLVTCLTDMIKPMKNEQE